jgi:hypothetical protein
MLDSLRLFPDTGPEPRLADLRRHAAESQGVVEGVYAIEGLDVSVGP